MVHQRNLKIESKGYDATMFILLALILTVIAISLKLSASGLELANAVSKRFAKDNKVIGVARLGIATSVTFMRFIAFIISRIRDLVSIIGSLDRKSVV